jgi:cellobiose-specific phosphotransferase system component IIA
VKQAAYGETLTAMIKKKLMKNQILIEASAPANASQLSSINTKAVKDTSKFIVVLLHGREQLVTFPAEIQHADKLGELQKHHAEVKAISAGFFMGDSTALWVGGESMSLELASRPQDTEIIRSFLANGGAK